MVNKIQGELSMPNTDLLFEIKPKYNIFYTIFAHLFDIAIFIFILVMLRFKSTIVFKRNCSVYHNFNSINCCITFKKKS